MSTKSHFDANLFAFGSSKRGAHWNNYIRWKKSGKCGVVEAGSFEICGIIIEYKPVQKSTYKLTAQAQTSQVLTYIQNYI